MIPESPDLRALSRLCASEPEYRPSPVGIALLATAVVLTLAVIKVPQSRPFFSSLLMFTCLAIYLRGVRNQP